MRPAALLALSAYLQACDPAPISCLDAEDLRSWTMLANEATARPQLDTCGRATSAQLDIGSGSVRMIRDFSFAASVTLNLIANVTNRCAGTAVELTVGDQRRTEVSFPAVIRMPVQALQPVTASALWSGSCAGLHVSLRSAVE